jgi:hypothetical protein
MNMSNALAKQNAETSTESMLLDMLRTLPADTVIRSLRTLHRDLLEQALAPEPAIGASPQGKRREVRQRALRSAKVIYNNRSCLVDCQIRDLSRGGCRIRTANSTSVPAIFELQIIGVPEIRLCEVRWRNATEVGVRFITAGPSP